MQRILILHTNDIRGRVEGLARMATLAQVETENPGMPVLYFDCGDVEEPMQRLSMPMGRLGNTPAAPRMIQSGDRP